MTSLEIGMMEMTIDSQEAKDLCEVIYKVLRFDTKEKLWDFWDNTAMTKEVWDFAYTITVHAAKKDFHRMSSTHEREKSVLIAAEKARLASFKESLRSYQCGIDDRCVAKQLTEQKIQLKEYRMQIDEKRQLRVRARCAQFGKFGPIVDELWRLRRTDGEASNASFSEMVQAQRRWLDTVQDESEFLTEATAKTVRMTERLVELIEQ